VRTSAPETGVIRSRRAAIVTGAAPASRQPGAVLMAGFVRDFVVGNRVADSLTQANAVDWSRVRLGQGWQLG